MRWPPPSTRARAPTRTASPTSRSPSRARSSTPAPTPRAKGWTVADDARLRRRRHQRRRVRQPARLPAPDERAEAAAAVPGARHVGGVAARPRGDRDRATRSSSSCSAGVRVFFYLEDRERTLDTPDRQGHARRCTAFADELEREKARQRTYDAMQPEGARRPRHRRARVRLRQRRRYVGRDGRPTSHVERRDQRGRGRRRAARSSSCCAPGHGRRRDREAAERGGRRAPRPQQGRPAAWAPSSVREVLHRDALPRRRSSGTRRGSATRGAAQQSAGPPGVRVDARARRRQLRIVSDDAVEGRARAPGERAGELPAVRQRASSGAGRSAGRPRSICCTGSARVRPLRRLAGGRTADARPAARVTFYACSSYSRSGATRSAQRRRGHQWRRRRGRARHRRDRRCCDPAVVERAIDEDDRACRRPRARDGDPARDCWRAIATIDAELLRLTAPLRPAAMALPSVVQAIAEREARKARPDAASSPRSINSARRFASTRRRVTQRIAASWPIGDDAPRDTCRRPGRCCGSCCAGGSRSTPEERNGLPGFRFRARGHRSEAASGWLADFPHGVASPAGFEPAFWP